MKHKKQLYLLTKQAEQDITDIEAYIAEHNQAAAERLVHRIFNAFDLLVAHPEAGHIRTDLTDRQVLFWPVKPRFLVIYTPRETSILIIRVLPSDRDIAKIILYHLEERHSTVVISLKFGTLKARIGQNAHGHKVSETNPTRNTPA